MCRELCGVALDKISGNKGIRYNIIQPGCWPFDFLLKFRADTLYICPISMTNIENPCLSSNEKSKDSRHKTHQSPGCVPIVTGHNELFVCAWLTDIA